MILVDKKLLKFFCFLFFLLIFGCSNKSQSKHLISGSTMGTTYNITILGIVENETKLKISLEEILDSVNISFSTYNNNSEISKINNYDTGLIKLSKNFSYVLKKALYYCDISNGKYDITISPLVKLWGFESFKEVKVPQNNLILEQLANVGYKKIHLSNNFLVKQNKKIQIDLNSIAKGFAVDRISEFLYNNGFKNHLVEIGGELKSSRFGDSKKKWIIGIQNPQNLSVIKKINLSNMSMATSGTYNNFFEIDGVQYSHLINPMTGFPIDHQTVSATVISKECIDSDALATVLMTMMPSEGIDFINNLDNIEAMIIKLDEKGNLIEFLSKGFSSFIVGD
ncbi:MAG: lipoprotein ApbE [Candidatus Marinimicrobia bacterium]|nr:lipoprotein ApbE [Candidatus Neomarinimicrobiota bacterium]|tara:strand:- start:34884 stop:35900 length:1017 start_codon:yes stop_codon:yes gene_type:complete